MVSQSGFAVVDPDGSQTGDAGIVASASFMPAVAAYSAGDVVGAAQEFAFHFADALDDISIPPGKLIRITTTVIKIAQTALQTNEAGYVLPLFSATPPSALADNAAYTGQAGDLTAYRDKLALGTPVDEGGFCYIKTQLTDKQDIKLLGSSLWGYLQTVGATIYGAAVARQILLYGIIL